LAPLAGAPRALDGPGLADPGPPAVDRVGANFRVAGVQRHLGTGLTRARDTDTTAGDGLAILRGNDCDILNRRIVVIVFDNRDRHRVCGVVLTLNSLRSGDGALTRLQVTGLGAPVAVIVNVGLTGLVTVDIERHRATRLARALNSRTARRHLSTI